MRQVAATVLALVGIALVSAGCANDVTGLANPATNAVKILPTADQITDAVGNPLSTFDFKPFIGGVEILPDGYRTEADASPIDCVTVTDTAMRVVYEPMPVLEAARQSYFNLDDGVGVSGADTAVIRLATADAAEDAYRDFVRKWQQCDGKTVVKHLRSASNSDLVATISDVEVDGQVVSAVVSTRQGQNAPTARYQRALATRGDAVVEVSLGLTRSGERQTDKGAAAATARLMLDKVGPNS